MPACQIGKYRPGGRCGGQDSGAGVKKDAGSLGGALAALLASREKLDAAVIAPVSAAHIHKPEKPNAITLFTPVKKDIASQRQADINLILDE